MAQKAMRPWALLSAPKFHRRHIVQPTNGLRVEPSLFDTSIPPSSREDVRRTHLRGQPFEVLFRQQRTESRYRPKFPNYGYVTIRFG